MINTTITQVKVSFRKLHKELKNKTTTTLDVLNKSLQRANEVRDLNAFITFTSDLVKQATISQGYYNKGKPRSLLEGIPIAVKDNFCVENVKTTCASKMLETFTPKYTATVINKLLKCGSILIGKTNMDEFAMGSGTIYSIYGPTKNVWGSKFSKIKVQNALSDWYISGGSSGGSAVAVASGICLGGIGSDTGGSTRNPASYCGVVGLKPSYGLLSRHGLIPLVNSMDVPGILSNNVEDAFILLKVMAGPDEKDSTTIKTGKSLGKLAVPSVLKNIKVGIPIEYNCEHLCEDVKSTWKKVGQLLEKAGAKVEPISMSHIKYSNACYSVLNQCEVASNMAKYDGIEFGNRYENSGSCENIYAKTRSSNFNLVVRRRILVGNYFLLKENYEKYYVKAMKIRRLIANDFLTAWRKGYNLLLTPTTLTDAPKFSEFIQQDEREQCAKEDYCTQPANMAGCPAISIPIELSRRGLPLSVQLMAPNFEDLFMLEIALLIEKEVQFYQYK